MRKANLLTCRTRHKSLLCCHKQLSHGINFLSFDSPRHKFDVAAFIYNSFGKKAHFYIHNHFLWQGRILALPTGERFKHVLFYSPSSFIDSLLPIILLHNPSWLKTLQWLDMRKPGYLSKKRYNGMKTVRQKLSEAKPWRYETAQCAARRLDTGQGVRAGRSQIERCFSARAAASRTHNSVLAQKAAIWGELQT